MRAIRKRKMPLRWRTSTERRSRARRAPRAPPARSAMPLCASGVKKNIGRMKTRYQQRRQRPGDARILAVSSGRGRTAASMPMIVLPVSGEPARSSDDEDQHDHAAEIAKPPGDVGDLADLGLRHQARHHRIVEDDREFRRDRGEREEQHRPGTDCEPGAANHSSDRLTILIDGEEARSTACAGRSGRRSSRAPATGRR